MDFSPTLSADEFKNVHNGLCKIHAAAARLEEAVSKLGMNSTLVTELEAGLKLVREGLSRAYQEEDRSFSERTHYYDRLAEENKFSTIWSIHEIPDMLAPHPYEGTLRLVYLGQSMLVAGSRWLDLWAAADQLIKLSGDEHHIFIEAFKLSTNGQELYLSTGS